MDRAIRSFIVFVLLAFIGLSGTSCTKVTLVVEALPENTPEQPSIFVTGNFNFWDPSDRSFLLKEKLGNKYLIDLPYGWGTVNYKFTRGDWKTVEKNACGHEVYNRIARYFLDDTIKVTIASWADLGPTNCQEVTFVVDLPKETPKDDTIYVASNFNQWDPFDKESRLNRDSSGKCYIKSEKIPGVVEFKFTRGSWDTEEVDENRNPIANRTFVFGKQDTVYLKVNGWKDITPGYEKKMVHFIVQTPPNTRDSDRIFLTGTFNDWVTNYKNYQLTKISKNLFSFSFEKPEGKMEFKFTRGSWDSEEVDQYYNVISNRVYQSSSDTILVKINGWKDRSLRFNK